MFSITPMLGGFQRVVSYPMMGATPTQLVKPDARRAILYVINGQAANLDLWPNPTVPFDGQMPTAIVLASGTLRYTWSQDGPMSTYGYLAALETGSGAVTVIEILWLPEQLQGGV